MPNVADLSVRYSADTSNFESGTNKVQGLISGLTSGAKGLATVAGGFLLANAVQNVVGGVGKLAGAGLDFQQQMANVNSVLQDDAAVKKYGDALIALSSDPRVLAGPSELAAGFYNVASAGFTGQGALDVMTAAAMAATAGMTTADTAASAIAGTMNAFGQNTYTATQVSDALFGAVAAGSLTFEQLANNLGNTTSLASTMGVSLEELSSAYAVMSNNNINASIAETQISSLMRSALNPTEALTQAVTAHGYASAEAAIQAEGLGGFIDLVTESAGGSKEALFDMLGTTEAMNAALILGAEGGEEYADVLDQITKGVKTGTTTQKALEKQMDSARFKMAEARKQVEITATLLGGALAPAIGKAAAAFSGLIQGATKLGQGFLDTVGNAEQFSKWVQQFPGWAQPALKALGGMYQAGGDLVDAFQDFKRGDFAGGFRELGEAASTAWDSISALATTTLDWVINTGVPAVTGWLVEHAGDIWGGIKTLVGVTFDGITAAISWTADVGIPSVIGGITSIAGRAGDWLRGMLVGGLSTVGDGTGGPEPTGANGSITSLLGAWTINVGVPSVVGAITSIAGRLGDWLRGYLMGGSLSNIPVIGGIASAAAGGIEVELGTILLKVLDATTDLTADDVNGWLQKYIDAAGDFKATINTWTLSVDSEPKVEGDPHGKAEHSLALEILKAAYRFSGFEWAVETSRDPDIIFDPVRMIYEQLSKIVAGADVSLKDIKWFAQMANPIIAFQTGWDFAKSIKDKLPPVNIQALKWAISLALPTINLPSKDQIMAAVRVAGEKLGIPGFILDAITGGSGGGQFGQGVTGGPGSHVSPPGSSQLGLGGGTPGGIDIGNGTLVSQLPNVGSGSTAGIGAMATAATQAAATISAAMKLITGAVGSGATAVQTAATGITTSLTNLGVAFATAQTFISTTMTAVSTAVQTSATTITTTLTNLGVAFATAQTFVTTAMTQMATAITTAMVNAGIAVTTGTTVMTTALTTFATAAGTAGTNAGNSFARGVTTGMVNAAVAASVGVSSIESSLNSIGDNYGPGYSIGQSFGQGIYDGLMSMVGAVAAAAATLVATAASSAQARGQIASPSKLMRDEIGIPLGQGVVVGLESQRRTIADTFASMLPVDARLGRGYQPGGISGGGRYAAGTAQTVNVYHIYQVKSDELVRIQRGAEGGLQYQKDSSPLARLTTYGTVGTVRT